MHRVHEIEKKKGKQKEKREIEILRGSPNIL